MNVNELVRDLRVVKKNYIGVFTGTGEINIAAMVTDCIDMIEQQQKELDALREANERLQTIIAVQGEPEQNISTVSFTKLPEAPEGGEG